MTMDGSVEGVKDIIQKAEMVTNQLNANRDSNLLYDELRLMSKKIAKLACSSKVIPGDGDNNDNNYCLGDNTKEGAETEGRDISDRELQKAQITEGKEQDDNTIVHRIEARREEKKEKTTIEEKHTVMNAYSLSNLSRDELESNFCLLANNLETMIILNTKREELHKGEILRLQHDNKLLTERGELMEQALEEIQSNMGMLVQLHSSKDSAHVSEIERLKTEIGLLKQENEILKEEKTKS